MGRAGPKVGVPEGVYPFAKIYCKGEQPTRSAVCTYSALHSLRPYWTAFLNSLLEETRLPSLATTYLIDFVLGWGGN